MESTDRNSRTISVGALGLDLCGHLRRARQEEKPLIVTTRRAVTHLILPITNPDQIEGLISSQQGGKSNV